MVEFLLIGIAIGTAIVLLIANSGSTVSSQVGSVQHFDIRATQESYIYQSALQLPTFECDDLD